MNFIMTLVTIIITVSIGMAQESPCLEKAHRALRIGNFPLALSLTADCPATPGQQRARGLAYSNLYNADSSLFYLQKAHKNGVTDDDVLTHLARSLLWKKEFKHAVILLKQVKDPSAMMAMHVYALYYQMMGNLKAACTLYDSILVKAPNNYDALIEYGEVLSWDKQFDKSIYVFTKVRHAKGVSDLLKYRAMNRTAQVLSWKKEFSAAHAILDTVLRNDAKNSEARLLKGEIYEWEGKFPLAKAAYSDILLIDNSHKVAKLRLEKLLWVK